MDTASLSAQPCGGGAGDRPLPQLGSYIRREFRRPSPAREIAQNCYVRAPFPPMAMWRWGGGLSVRPNQRRPIDGWRARPRRLADLSGRRRGSKGRYGSTSTARRLARKAYQKLIALNGRRNGEDGPRLYAITKPVFWEPEQPNLRERRASLRGFRNNSR